MVNRCSGSTEEVQRCRVQRCTDADAEVQGCTCADEVQRCTGAQNARYDGDAEVQVQR